MYVSKTTFFVCASFIFLYHVNDSVNRDFVPEQGPVRGSVGER